MKRVGELLSLGEMGCKALTVALKCVVSDLYFDLQRKLSDDEWESFQIVYSRLKAGEPLAYIVGEWDFYGLTYEVTPAVLIPRPETELLVEESLKIQPASLLDLCCGSGCIGISVKKNLKTCEVTLSDISSEALAIAKQNAKAHEVEVEFLEGDFLRPFQKRCVDLLVCNPPYITEGEYEGLDFSVKGYEPKSALFGGEDGLYFMRRLVEEAPGRCKTLLVEMGALQSEAVSELFRKEGFTRQKILFDYSGKPRHLRVEIE